MATLIFTVSLNAELCIDLSLSLAPYFCFAGIVSCVVGIDDMLRMFVVVCLSSFVRLFDYAASSLLFFSCGRNVLCCCCMGCLVSLVWLSMDVLSYFILMGYVCVSQI